MESRKADYPLLVGSLRLWSVVLFTSYINDVKLFSSNTLAEKWLVKNDFKLADDKRRWRKHFPNAAPNHKYQFADIREHVVDDWSDSPTHE